VNFYVYLDRSNIRSWGKNMDQRMPNWRIYLLASLIYDIPLRRVVKAAYPHAAELLQVA